MDVAAWLRDLGLGEYETAFRDNAIEPDVLSSLTVEDLKEIGVSAVGHRRKLLDAIAALSGATKEAAMPSAPQVATPGAERRQLTVMFCDLVGSTALSARLDPEDMRAIVAAYHSLCRQIVEQHGGFVAEYLGDGLLVYFGYPGAHEDDAERAVRAGLELVADVPKLVTAANETLHVRIGVATGVVVVGDQIGSGDVRKRGVVGDTPNLAARLQAIAEADSLVVCAATRKLLGALFSMERLGAQDLKGLSRPVEVFRVLGESGADDRFRALRSEAAPFVGREEELELIARRWRQTAAEGGRAILIGGEAGLGKSRLLVAARERMATDGPAIVVCFCAQNFANTALYPVVRQIERACGLTDERADPARRKELDALLGDLVTPEASALIADLLSVGRKDDPDPIDHLSPAEKRKATFDLLVRHYADLSRERGLVLVFEDIHWADASTLELIDRVISRIESLQILLIATHRPEFVPSWAGQRQASVMTLARLSTREQKKLIAAVAGGSLAGKAIDEIAERADGVPLFVEELTKATIEAGGETEETLARSAGMAAIPATLHASLMARLDRLGPVARSVAQVGAVIGRDFSRDLLSAAWTGALSDMDNALAHLRDAGLIFVRGEGDQASYLFKHALVQDAAYSTLLREPKQALHRAVATLLEQRKDATLIAELIARHWRAARESRRASEWWLTAGRAASENSAHREAIESIQNGLAEIASLPETTMRKELELELVIALTVPNVALYSFGSEEAREPIERSEALSRELGRARPAPLLFHRWLFHHGRNENELALPIARELEESLKDHPLGVRASHSRLQSEMHLGYDMNALTAEFRRVFDKVFSFGPEFDRLRFTYTYDFKAICACGLSNALWYSGHPDQAVAVCEKGRTRATRLRHAMTECCVLFWEIVVHSLRGDFDMLRVRSEECIEIAHRENLGHWISLVSVYSSLAKAFDGDPEVGLAQLDAATADMQRVGYDTSKPYIMLNRSHILALNGRDEEALATIEQAISIALKAQELVSFSELRRLRGEFLLEYRNDPVGAEREFRDALAFARTQNALSYELRISTSLANLMRRRGEAARALELLAPVYDRFAEGFGTADLVAAKKTIDELKLSIGAATS